MIPSRPSRSLYKPGAAGQPVPKSEVAHHFELARNFLSQALAANSKWMAQMEESATPYEAAMKILQHRDDLDTARIFLLTNGVVKQADEQGMEIAGVEVKHYLWDLGKLLPVSWSWRSVWRAGVRSSSST